MKNLVLLLIIMAACTSKETSNNPSTDISAEAAKEIRDTDIAMSIEATRIGFNKALLLYADDNLIKPEEGKHPIKGKHALEQHYAGEAGSQNLTWTPTIAEAAASGELGYTLGNWTLRTSDTTYHGMYYTIWKKQADGKWKWVVDGGNNTPAPE